MYLCMYHLQYVMAYKSEVKHTSWLPTPEKIVGFPSDATVDKNLTVLLIWHKWLDFGLIIIIKVKLTTIFVVSTYKQILHLMFPILVMRIE